MFLHDRVHGGQSKSHATFLGREVRVKDPVEVLRPDPLAVVGKREAQVSPGRKKPVVLLPHLLVAHRYVDRAALRHRLHGVDHDVLDHLAYLPLVDIGGPEPLLDVEPAMHSGAVQGKLGDLAYDIGKQDGDLDRSAALCEGEQLKRQVLGPVGGLLGIAQRLGGLRGYRPVVEHKGDVPDYGREQVVEVVGYPACQESKGLELVCTLELGLKPRLLHALLPNLLGLAVDLAAERNHPGDEHQDRDRKRPGERQDPLARQPWGSAQQRDIARVAKVDPE